MSAPEQLRTGSRESAAMPTPQFGALEFKGFRGRLRAGTSFLAVLTILLIGIVYLFAIYSPNMDDPDIWWHMRDAQYLFQHHHFLRQDVYSFTVAGHPWVNTEWLSEIPYYLAYRAFGLQGLKTLAFTVLCTIALLLLYFCYRESGNFKASAFACYFVTLLATVSFGPRTILFGYLCLVLLLIILQRFRQHGDAPLWSIPLLFCLWASTHGSWSLGLIVFFLFVASGFVNISWGRLECSRWTPVQLKKLILTAIVTVAALFVNPYGWRLVYYPFDLAFRQKLNIGHVQEWVSVNFHDGRGKLVMILIFALLIGALFRNRRWRLDEILILLFGLYCGLTYLRFLALLAIVVAPILAKTLNFLPGYRPQSEHRWLNAAVLLAVIVAMIFYWPRKEKIHDAVAKTYPAGAIAYLHASPPQGNVLNFYLWGGYLGWHDPQLKDFVDSRVDIFEYAGVLKDYLDLLGTDNLRRQPDAILAKYQIQYVIFPVPENKNPLLAAGQLVPVLEHDSRWKAIYQDNVCVLLKKQ